MPDPKPDINPFYESQKRDFQLLTTLTNQVNAICNFAADNPQLYIPPVDTYIPVTDEYMINAWTEYVNDPYKKIYILFYTPNTPYLNIEFKSDFSDFQKGIYSGFVRIYGKDFNIAHSPENTSLKSQDNFSTTILDNDGSITFAYHPYDDRKIYSALMKHIDSLIPLEHERLLTDDEAKTFFAYAKHITESESGHVIITVNPSNRREKISSNVESRFISDDNPQGVYLETHLSETHVGTNALIPVYDHNKNRIGWTSYVELHVKDRPEKTQRSISSIHAQLTLKRLKIHLGNNSLKY